MPVENFPRSLSLNNRGLRYVGGKLDYAQTDNVSISWTNSRVGVKNPRWRWQIRNGLNATTGFSYQSRDRFPDNTVGYFSFYDPSKDGGKKVEIYVNQRGSGITTEQPTDLSLSSADYKARQNFVNKYRKRRTAFQSGVFLGELMQTVRLIKSPAKALRKGIDRYYSDVKKRLRRRGVTRGHGTGPGRNKPDKDRNRIVQDTWLEYVFGWAPLISDIKDISKLATADPHKVFVPIRSIGGIAWRSDNQDTTRGPSVGGAPVWTERYYKEYASSVIYRGAVVAENNPPPFSEQFGLNWSNFLPTVWELIPYSFLVDYFFNVQKVVEGISTGTIWLAWGCKTSRKEIQFKKLIIPNPKATSSNYGSNMWSGVVTAPELTGRSFDLLRESVEGVSVGLSDFSFSLPGSERKWLNIAALARMRR